MNKKMKSQFISADELIGPIDLPCDTDLSFFETEEVLRSQGGFGGIPEAFEKKRGRTSAYARHATKHMRETVDAM